MKATLTFNLDEDDESVAHLRAVKAFNAWESLASLARQIMLWGDSVESISMDTLSKTFQDILDKNMVDLREMELP